MRRETVRERVKKLRTSLKMDQTKFSVQVLGLPVYSYRRRENGRSEFNQEDLQMLHRTFPWLNMDWLITGRGEMKRLESR